MGTVAALYPTVVVLVAPVPAIVPPVARMTTFGSACPVVSTARTAGCQMRKTSKKGTNRIFMDNGSRCSLFARKNQSGRQETSADRIRELDRKAHLLPVVRRR